METILCVDDDQSAFQLYYKEFTDEGYKVILTKEGKGRCRNARKKNPIW